MFECDISNDSGLGSDYCKKLNNNQTFQPNLTLMSQKLGIKWYKQKYTGG